MVNCSHRLLCFARAMGGGSSWYWTTTVRCDSHHPFDAHTLRHECQPSGNEETATMVRQRENRRTPSRWILHCKWHRWLVQSDTNEAPWDPFRCITVPLKTRRMSWYWVWMEWNYKRWVSLVCRLVVHRRGFRSKKMISSSSTMFFTSMQAKINCPFVSDVKRTFSSSISSSADGFKTFPQLVHLDLSCNQIKNIKLNINDYETLEVGENIIWLQDWIGLDHFQGTESLLQQSDHARSRTAGHIAILTRTSCQWKWSCRSIASLSQTLCTYRHVSPRLRFVARLWRNSSVCHVYFSHSYLVLPGSSRRW